ncbi:putative 39S ribosomal protein L19, mitochondrial [Apostichopus japonicus]|uniref:Large ribosomal subunit protein bL19m n=1 Tax=Stichopus japonicus TaxID=307972 RepID=A0A2G8JKX6_STIJA|nr:putative 39S ribosomal protein L19, mitochondrial [Apostichopus japonicus]
MKNYDHDNLCPGGNVRHFASQDSSGKDEPPTNSKSPSDNEVDAIPERLSPDNKAATLPAPKISLDLLRRRQAQKKDQEQVEKFITPEIYPPMGRRSKILDYLERQDCFKRRMVMDIPEFYVGSILAVTMADPHANGKTSRLVGICIERKNYGLGASFKLRNVIDGQGLEVLYELYSPLLHKLEVLKLEKRTDAHLLYLRDALPEYSTIDPDMIAIKHPPGRPVPVNDIVVKMKPRPWHRRWERYELKGLDVSGVSQSRMATVQDHILPEYKKMDLLMMYPRYDITEKERMRIEREWEVHQNELERTAKKGS